MKLITQRSTAYQIVYKPVDYSMEHVAERYRDAEVDAAETLRKYFEHKLGIAIPSAEDTQPAGALEILVGETNREAQGYTVDRAALGDDGFTIFASDGRLVIAGGDEEGTVYAVDHLITKYLEPWRLSGEADLTLPDDFRITQPSVPKIGRITISGENLADFVIVHGADAYISEKTAAQMLQKYLFRACGVKLPICTDAEPEHRCEIIVGKTNREGAAYTVDRDRMYDDGFVILTRATKLVIAGAIRKGTLFGVYTFLENYIGYRWYVRHLCALASQEKIAVADGITDEQIPIYYSMRVPYWRQSFDDWGDGFRVRNKIYSDEVDQPLAFGGGGPHVQGGHSFQYYFPEISPATEQPCLSDPETFTKIMERIRRYLKEHPNTSTISVSQNDNGNSCHCPRCKALNDRYGGSDSGSMIWFVNKVAEAVEKEFPGLMVHTFAYMQTSVAPKNIVCRDNVIVQLCTMFCCFSHSLTDKHCQTDYNNWFVKQVDMWKDIAPNLWIWDYSTDFTHPCAIFPDFKTMYDNIRFFSEKNVIGYMTQGEHAIIPSFGELHAYAAAKMLWNPRMSWEEYSRHINDFLACYYGAGWENIRRYIDIAEELSDQHEFGCYENPEKIVNFAGIADELNALFDDAEAKAETYMQKENVRMLRLTLKYQLLVNTYNREYQNGTDESREAYRQKHEALYREACYFGACRPEKAPDFTQSPINW